MTRMTMDEVNDCLAKAEKIVEVWSQVSKTRGGTHIKTQTGLSSRTMFVGYAFDEQRVVCEDVS
jgi:hypothetical protein